MPQEVRQTDQCLQSPSQRAPVTDTPENKAMIQILTRLAGILEKPLKSDVSLMGRGGFLEKMAEYERMKERGKLG